jgi:hypothetical protein
MPVRDAVSTSHRSIGNVSSTADDRTARFREYRPLSAVALVLSYPCRGSITDTPLDSEPSNLSATDNEVSPDEATTLIQRTHDGATLHTFLRNGWRIRVAYSWRINVVGPIQVGRRVCPMANATVIAYQNHQVMTPHHDHHRQDTTIFASLLLYYHQRRFEFLGYECHTAWTASAAPTIVCPHFGNGDPIYMYTSSGAFV